MNKNLGGNIRTVDERDYLLGMVQTPVVPPSAYMPDNSWLVRNYQGKLPMCGEHAGTHMKAILDYIISNFSLKERKTPRYGTIKLKDPNSPVCDGFAIDAGTNMRNIFIWLKTLGADDFEPLENNVTLPIETYCSPSVITPDMDANAAASKISNYAFCNTDYESICQAIFQNKAVLLLIKCDNGFWGTSTPTFTTPEYGHFVVADGYNETGIRVIDSADPDDALAVKMIEKQYITSEFIIEAGTAVDIAPSVVAVLKNQTLTVSEKQSIISNILADIAQAINLIQQEINQSQKVANKN